VRLPWFKSRALLERFPYLFNGTFRINPQTAKTTRR
jgi:hypothetical protein